MWHNAPVFHYYQKTRYVHLSLAIQPHHLVYKMLRTTPWPYLLPGLLRPLRINTALTVQGPIRHFTSRSAGTLASQTEILPFLRLIFSRKDCTGLAFSGGSLCGGRGFGGRDLPDLMVISSTLLWLSSSPNPRRSLTEFVKFKPQYRRIGML